MVKIKLIAIAVFLTLTAIALSNSRNFVTFANGDVLQEIAQYKTWQRLNKNPIKVMSRFQTDDKSTAENSFIIDGQETQNYKNGVLNG